MTDAERRLWSRLRHEQLGVKFRRQHPIGSYVLDFACLTPKLAIEVDGSQHLDQQPYDARRDAWLIGQGFLVFGLWTNEVLAHTFGVVGRIVDSLAMCPGPAPTPTLPQRGRERTPTPALPKRGREQSASSASQAGESREESR